jgi:hypothetical protein
MNWNYSNFKNCINDLFALMLWLLNIPKFTLRKVTTALKLYQFDFFLLK